MVDDVFCGYDITPQGRDAMTLHEQLLANRKANEIAMQAKEEYAKLNRKANKIALGAVIGTFISVAISIISLLRTLGF